MLDGERPNEIELIEKAIAGDEAALSAVLRDWSPRIRRFAYRFCPTSEVLDAVQETLIVVSKRISGLRSAKALVSWLFQIVKRQCQRILGLISRESRIARRLERLLPDAEEAPSRQVEMVAILQSALLSLEARERQILMLRDMEGLSTRETAAHLGIGEAAVKSRLHRAREAVKEKLLALL